MEFTNVFFSPLSRISLIEIVTICSKCLMAFSPSLLELLTDPEFLPTKWPPLIEIQFNAPKISVGSTMPQLTFGTILNAAIIFTKALNIVSFVVSSFCT